MISWDLLAGVRRQIEAHGPKRRSSMPQWWNVPPPPRQHRAEEEAPNDPDMHFSADAQARWIKNGIEDHAGLQRLSSRPIAGLRVRISALARIRLCYAQYSLIIRTWTIPPMRFAPTGSALNAFWTGVDRRKCGS